MPPHLANRPLLPSDHHRRNSNQVRLRICEDYKELMGTAECPPPTDMPRKGLKYTVARGAIQETIPLGFQTGDTFPALYSSRVNLDRAKSKCRPFFFPSSRIDGAGPGRQVQAWLNSADAGHRRINRIRQGTSAAVPQQFEDCAGHGPPTRDSCGADVSVQIQFFADRSAT